MKKHLLSLLMTSAICAVSVSGYTADVSSIVSGAQSATQTASQVNAGVNNIAQTANAGQSTGAIGRGLQTATGKVSTGIQTATPYINDASTALNASQSVANAGNALVHSWVPWLRAECSSYPSSCYSSVQKRLCCSAS